VSGDDYLTTFDYFGKREAFVIPYINLRHASIHVVWFGEELITIIDPGGWSTWAIISEPLM